MDTNTALTIAFGIVICAFVLRDALTAKRPELKDHEFDVGDCRSCKELTREPYLTCAIFETQDGATEWVLTCVIDKTDLHNWAVNYARKMGWEFLSEAEPMDVINQQFEGIAHLTTSGKW